jgi:RimJ/RimL family protein N-acetyltransferase
MMLLQNKRVRLAPLTRANYRELLPIASEPGLVRYSPGNLSDPKGFETYMQAAINQAASGNCIPFIIYDKVTDSVAGSTRFMRIDQRNKVLEIGATWMGKAFWGTGLNDAVKSLQLRQAFGPMGFEKVVFRIDERNVRSRKAVEKLGAQLEGIMRKDVYLHGGFKRNTCIYGLLKEEWSP